MYGPYGPYGGRAPMVGKHKKAKITDEWVISEFSSVQTDEEQESAEQNHMCARYEKALDSFLSTPLHLQEGAEQNHMFARYEEALDSFLSTPTAATTPHAVTTLALSALSPHQAEQESAEQNHMCARYEKALDSFLSAPTDLTTPHAVTTLALSALSPHLQSRRARSRTTSPIAAVDSGRQLALPPLTLTTAVPPWLQWTLVAQLALPPLTLTTAIHEFHDATYNKAATTAAQLTESSDAGNTIGADDEANTARPAKFATGSANAVSSTPDASANAAELLFSNQKLDEHVQRWLMGRIPKRAWSDVAQCVAWYRPDLVFTRHPAFEVRFEPQKPFFQRLFPSLFPALEYFLPGVSCLPCSALLQALGLPVAATRAAVLAAYEAATWRQQASILRHVARLQLSADWDLLGLSAASAGGYIATGDGDKRSGDSSDGDSNEDEWGEQDQTEEDEEDEGEIGEEGEGGDSEAEEGEEEDEDLVWSEAEEQRALARDVEMLKQQGGQGITSQGLLSEGLTGGGDIDILAGGGAAAATAGAAGESDNDGSISDGGDELSVMEQTLVRKKEEAAGEVKAAVGPFDSVRLIGELTLLHAIETGEETF
ncbi:unnamed protein product [Closterium sp. Naga37s-1]|nr:unnamed protein product [Closterium sp. Naga37s-1]